MTKKNKKNIFLREVDKNRLLFFFVFLHQKITIKQQKPYKSFKKIEHNYLYITIVILYLTKYIGGGIVNLNKIELGTKNNIRPLCPMS